MNTNGIITQTSQYTVKETTDRIAALLTKNGITIYSRIDQQSEVRNTGRAIQPIELLVFGNPANGGAIMAYNPLAALDLPLKILAWEDADRIVRVSFNDPGYLQKRYDLPGQLTTPLDLEPLIAKALL